MSLAILAVIRAFDCHSPACKIKIRVWADAETSSVGLAARGLLKVGIRIWKLLILLFIVLLLFSSRLPSVARALGQSIIEFKKGIKELENHSDDETSA